MKREWRTNLSVALAVLASGALAGCTVNPATGEQNFTAFMSQDQEKRIGAQEHPKILKQFGGEYDDPVIRQYVQKIGNNLAVRSELPNLRFTFTVLNSPQINAFALPGGFVYVTRGLLALAGNEAELAGVMAHEIGHVTARHSAQRYSRGMAIGLAATVLGVLAGSSAVSDLAGLGANLYLKSFSREQEFQADSLGVRYLSRTGYNTQAMATFLTRLRAHGKLKSRILGKSGNAADQPNLFATHPRTIDRVKRAISEARDAPSGNTIGRVEYMQKLHNMLYGDDPKEGFIRGQTFIHPKLRFRFEVPDGFRLFNSRAAVVAKGPGNSIIQFDISPKPYRGSVVNYIRDVWARQAPLENLGKIDVNGMRAATAIARISRQGKSFDVRFVAIRQNARRIFRFIFLTPFRLTQQLSVPLRRTTFSLRTISPGEAARFQPQRLRIRAVGPGDRARRFISQMAMPDFKAEWFAVLNGLNPGQRLRRGQLVKIVTENIGE